MNGTLAVAKREFKTFFASPIAYIVLGGFLLVSGGIYFISFLAAGEASMRGFFGIAPLVFVFLVPAITMRSIAEERKAGTLELLLTMPLEDWQIVLGKFLAALGMIGVGLLFSLPYAFTVAALTATGVSFDWGPVAAGYIGLLFLASSFIALGLWSSSLSKNQIVGFIISFVVCLAFYLVDKFAMLLPESLGQVLEYLSVDYHFGNIARGVLDTRDLLFYLSLTAAGLIFTTRALSVSASKVAQQSLFVAAVIGSLVLLNVLSLRLFGRLDVTRDGAYTLSKATKDTLGSLDESITITAYFTESLPAPYSSNARYVRDTLEEFRSSSKGKVSFEFIDPASQETDKDKETKKEMKQDIFGRRFREPTAIEKELATTGIQPVEIRVIEEDQQQTKRAYMGLVIRYGEKKEVIPVVQGVAGLEYDLTSLIRKMTRAKTPIIAVLQGHDEPKPQEKLQRFSSLLSQTYDIRPVELAQKERFDDEIDAVFVMGAKKALAPNELKAIDQFLMAGKPVAFMLDTVSVDLKTFESTPAQHGLNAMLASYGVTVGDKLIADASSANVNVQERRGHMVVSSPAPYPFIPVVKRLAGESPVSKGLGEVTFPFVSEVKATPLPGSDVVVLATSSEKSWLENSPANVDPRRDWRSETITPTGPYTLMVQVSGSMKSFFASEASMSGAVPLLAQSVKEARFIVIGSGELFTDDFLTSRPNAALLMNISDWLLLDPALLAMRNRGMAVTPVKTDLSDAARTAVKFGNPLGMALLLVAFGLIRWRMREARRSTETAS